MSKNDELTVAEKICIIREAMNISQPELGKIINRDASTISRIEKNHSKYTDEQLAAIRKFLGIENAPLLDNEKVEFRAGLYIWRDTTNSRRMDEARKMYHEFSVINKMPFEKELLMLFKMYEVNLLFHEDISLAEKALESARGFLNGATDEARHLFHFNVGSLNFRKGIYDVALQNYLIAHNLQMKTDKVNFTLQYNISLCYSRLGMYFRAIVSTERLLYLCSVNLTDDYWYRLRNQLAVYYMHVDEPGKAQELLGECLVRSSKNKNYKYIGYILHNLGYACLKTKELEEALGYFQRAFNYMKEGQDSYFENLYYETQCLIFMKNPLSKERLSYAKVISAGNKHYELLFNSLSHLMTLKENDSIQFIEQNTIQHLINKCEYFRALEYCELLEDVFKRQNKKTKTLEIGVLSRDILRRIMQG